METTPKLTMPQENPSWRIIPQKTAPVVVELSTVRKKISAQPRPTIEGCFDTSFLYE